jgi:hypothetical protein
MRGDRLSFQGFRVISRRNLREKAAREIIDRAYFYNFTDFREQQAKAARRLILCIGKDPRSRKRQTPQIGHGKQ